MVDLDKISAGNYSKLTAWQETPLGLKEVTDMSKRKEQRKKNPNLPSMEDGPGFRTTLLDGTVLDFTYDSDEDFLEGYAEFNSPENFIRLLAEVVGYGREEVVL